MTPYASPPPNPHDPIGYVLPASNAMERVRQVLFRPFDLGRWFVIGFCAFLASLGEMGGGGGGGNFRGKDGRAQMPSFDEAKVQVLDYVRENLIWLVPVVAFGVLAVITLVLLVLWLSSRGRFMFLDNVATNRAEVVRPWQVHRRVGNSLFWFRLLLGVIGFFVFCVVAAVGVVAALPLFRGDGPNVLSIAVLVVAGLLWVLFGVGLVVVAKLTKDFVVPIMWLRGCDWRAGWAEFGTLLKARPGAFVLYLLFHLLLWLVAGILVIGLILMTCCIAGCLLAIPYLGTVLFLPVLVFFRSYSVCFLAQFGPEYNVFLGGPPGPSAGGGEMPAAG